MLSPSRITLLFLLLAYFNSAHAHIQQTNLNFNTYDKEIEGESSGEDSGKLFNLHYKYVVDHQDCGPGNLLQLSLLGCDPEIEAKRRFCVLQRGSNMTLRARFIAEDNYAAATTEVSIRLGFLELPPIPGIDSNACLRYVHCPIRKGETVMADATVTVPRYVPAVGRPTVTVKLLSKTNKVIVCGQAKIGLK